MEPVTAAIITLEFWFGVAIGILFDQSAKRAIRSRVFGREKGSE
jgi:hypothetical protein